MFDFFIKNATVYSGLNEAPKVTNIGVSEGRITYIGTEEKPAKRSINAERLMLTPGFIDPHASTGFGYFFPNAADHKLYQGITTEIFGNCGTSPGPIGEHLIPTMERIADDLGFEFNWKSLDGFYDKIKDYLQFNIASLVGHSTLRGGALSDWKVVNDEDIATMKTALKAAMDEGALGFSTGLIYAPGCFAEFDELVELAKVVGENGGVYASHVRNERDKLEDAVDEALAIAEAAKIDVLISHLKSAEKQNWGKIPTILKKIEAFNAKNTEIRAACDVYPYTAVSTKLRAFIPKHILQDGIAAVAEKVKNKDIVDEMDAYILEKGYDMSQMLIISNDLTDFYAQTVGQISSAQNISEGKVIANILSQSTEAWVVYHCIDEKDMDTAIMWKGAMICTDSWSYPINAPKVIGQPHPRSYGAFTTFLERYVIQQKSLSWEEAIHKVTYLPAQFFRLAERGQIKEGYYADLVLFDKSNIKANATYLDPKRLSEGVEYLWVNGELVIDKKSILKTTPGQVLKPSKMVVG